MLDGHNIHVIRVEQHYLTIAISLSQYLTPLIPMHLQITNDGAPK